MKYHFVTNALINLNRKSINSWVLSWNSSIYLAMDGAGKQKLKSMNFNCSKKSRNCLLYPKPQEDKKKLMKMNINENECETLADLLDSLAIENKIHATGFYQDGKVGLYFCTSELNEEEIIKESGVVRDFLKKYVNDVIFIQKLAFADTNTMQVFINTE